MSELVGLLLLAIVTMVVLVSAGPTLVLLVHAAVPLVLAGGLVVILLRLCWYFTNRW